MALSYQEAKNIRSKTFSSMLTSRMVEGDSIGSSIRKTLSERSKARMTGIKEKFDPMNVAKFMTGGSKLGPALMGKLTGRSTEDIKYFTGDKTATKISQLEKGNELVEALMKVYDVLSKSEERKKLDLEKQNMFKEELELERLRRHKELIQAITGKPYTGKATAVKVDSDNNPFSFLQNIMNSFGGALSASSILTNVGKFFLLNPIGIGLLAGTSLLTLLSRDKDAEGTTKGILTAGDVSAQGQTIMDVVQNTSVIERRKMNLLADRPSNKKSLLFWKDGDLQKKYLEEIGFDETTGLTSAEKSQGFTALDENGTPIKKETPKPLPQPTQTPTTTSSATQEESTVTTPTPASAMAVTETPANVGQMLNQVVGENLSLDVQQKLSEGLTVVNNNSIKQSMKKQDTRGPLPPVRNDEETFQKMIWESTRVV